MTVSVYGSNAMQVKFDQRTHFFRDGKETTQMAVKRGDRVYLDTQLFEGKVFAKNVHIQTGNTPADASGQIMSFDRKSGNMVVFDQLAGSSVKFRVSPQTAIKSGDSGATLSSLRPGALIAVKFSPKSRNAGSADEISIIAEPGTAFTYFGRVTHLDIRSGSLSIENRADGKMYDVHFDPSARIPDNLLIGSQVTVVAMFEGNRYTTQSIEVNAGPDQALASGGQSLPSTPDAESNRKGDKHGKKKHDSKDENSKNNGDSDDDQL
jgi:co-chaperonin GroES (HSP10)